MSNGDNPDTLGWRIKAAEDSLHGLHEKVDKLTLTVERSLCQSPGLCLNLQEVTDRLTTILEKHERELTEVKTDITVAKTSGKILIGAATAIGTVVAAVVSIALDIFHRK